MLPLACPRRSGSSSVPPAVPDEGLRKNHPWRRQPVAHVDRNPAENGGTKWTSEVDIDRLVAPTLKLRLEGGPTIAADEDHARSATSRPDLRHGSLKRLDVEAHGSPRPVPAGSLT